MIQERNAKNAVTRQHAWGLNLGGGIGGLLNQRRSGKDYAYLYDASGNVEAVLNASQQVVAAYRYDPFGTLLAKTGTFDQPFQFSTKRADARIGMVQYEFRNYLPAIGRWMTRDPLGEAGGLNLYAFVGNNPVNWVDPWGLIDDDIVPVYEISDAEGGGAFGGIGGYGIRGGRNGSIPIPANRSNSTAACPVRFPQVVFSTKAQYQVTPGIRILKGQYLNPSLNRVEPWKAFYDQYGRLIARTDYNAANKAAGIPVIHHHIYEWGPGKTPLEKGSHLPGEYIP